MKLRKETGSSDARHGRWYDDACGTAFAMELIGERWSLLVVRELMMGGRRFSELRKALKKDGLLTSDSRIKERKKYGMAGARKRFQFSKR